MTGHEHYNVAGFQEAASRWAAAGHDPVTPFEANSIVWRKHFQRDFDPAVDRCDYGDALLPEMFLADLGEVARADAIALLPGWDKSRGARIEALLAGVFGKPLYCAATLQPLTLSATVLISHDNNTTGKTHEATR